VVLTSTLNQAFSDYVAPDVGLVVSPVYNAGGGAPTEGTCLQLPTSDAHTCSGDFGGHIQRGTSSILRGWVYFDLLTFCRPSPPDYMTVVSGTDRGALALFFASHESSFTVPSDVIRWQRTGCLASLRSAPLMFGNALGVMRLPRSLVDLDVRRRYRAPLRRVSAPHLPCLWTTSPGARALGTSSNSTIGLFTCLKSSYLKRWLLRDRICGWRSAVFGRDLLEIDRGMWFG
jgi:hypothetical protein